MSEEKSNAHSALAALSEEEAAVVQATGMMLVKSVIDEKVGIQLFKHVKTGEIIPVIGRMVIVEHATHTETQFTPLGMMFKTEPHLQVEPMTQPNRMTSRPIEIEMTDGVVSNISEVEQQMDSQSVSGDIEINAQAGVLAVKGNNTIN